MFNNLARLDQSVASLQRSENEVSIQVGVSLAVRWFIPALEVLKQRHPTLKIRVETGNEATADAIASDLAIIYMKKGDEAGDKQLLYRDDSRPFVAPALLQKVNFRGPQDIAKLVAIGSTGDDWDWQMWGEQAGVPQEQIRIFDHFDSDDAAIHAAVAGLGMALVPPILTQKEIHAGSLCCCARLWARDLGWILFGRRYLREPRVKNSVALVTRHNF